LGENERVLEACGDGVESLSAGILVFSSVLSLGLKLGKSCFVSVVGKFLNDFLSLCVEGVKFLHQSFVGKRVDLLFVPLLGISNHGGSENLLDFVRVDNSCEISTGHDVSVKLESLLLDSDSSISAENFIELGHSIFSPDNESSKMTTWGKLEEVKSCNVAEINSWQVSCCSLNKVVFVSVNNKGSSSHNVSGVSHLTFAWSQFLGGLDSSDIVFDSKSFEGLKHGGSGVVVEGVNNEGEFRNVVNLVTSGHDEGSASGGSKG